MRRAVEASDDEAILSLAKSVAKETVVLLKRFLVNHAQPDSDVVALHCWHDKQMVRAFIPTIYLKEHFRREHLTGKDANVVVDRHLDAFARIISTKYECGEYRHYSRIGSTSQRVDITLADIEASGEVLTDRVLNLKPVWMS